VFSLIKELGVPVLRTHLAAILEFQEGIHPDIVTKGLRDIKAAVGDGGSITQVKFGRLNRDLYCYGRTATDDELFNLAISCDKRDLLMSTWAKAQAGEQYFRSLLLRSGRFDKITRETRLGHVLDPEGKNALDMIARDATTGVTYGISVKNVREWLFAGNRAIRDAHVKATAHNLKPWLVVPFATPQAERACESRHVRLTSLHRQILPAESTDRRSMKRVIDDLYVVNGPIPYEILYKRHSITLDRSEAARRTLDELRAA